MKENIWVFFLLYLIVPNTMVSGFTDFPTNDMISFFFVRLTSRPTVFLMILLI